MPLTLRDAIQISISVAFAVACAALPMPAQSTWTLAASAGPTPRLSHAMGFDVLRGRAICFGGIASQGAGSAIVGDTWEWDGLNWAPQIFASGPSARYGARMVYDSIRSRLLLIGGVGNGAFPTNLTEVWSWNGITWQLISNNFPGSGAGASACFDSVRDRVVWLSPSASHPWEWDGVVWQQVITAGAPPARSDAAAAFDAARGRVLLHGGINSGTGSLLDDTWEWSGSSWQYKGAIANSVNPGRYMHTMYYDGARQRVVMVGGNVIVPTGPYTTGHQPTSQEWEWNGSVWVFGGSAPQGIARSEIVFDIHRNVAWVFGGIDASNAFIGNTWQRAGVGSGSPFGSGCGAPSLGLGQVLGAQPRLNNLAMAQVSSIPSAVAVMAIGFSRQYYGPFLLPLSLGGLGMPGCQLLHSADVFGESLAFQSPTTANYSLAIPNAPSLVGLHVYLQAFAVAPGMNPREIIASNGLDWNIGI